jgi:hypothetical protein
MKSFGWEVLKSKKEQLAIKDGNLAIQDSTLESYRKAKQSIEELIKVAEKTYHGLLGMKAKLGDTGLGTLNGIKSKMARVSGLLPFIQEARVMTIVLE